MHQPRRVIDLIALALCPLLLHCSPPVGTGSSSKPVTAPEYAAPTRAATKWALLVGINKYKHTAKVSNLSGCVNDVENMKTLLTGKFEFPKENLMVLKDEQATHAGIIDAFQSHLIAKAQRDDIVVFHYSGHGSQMRDNTGDEPDGLDETIVPHDSRDPQGKVFDISDDQLNGLLRQLSEKTKNITFVFDSCHSGTAVRAAHRMRRIPADPREPPKPPDYALTTRGVGEGASDVRAGNLHYVLISGSREKEVSFEHFADGRENGALTFFLTGALRRAPQAVTYRDVMDSVMGEVSAAYPNQHPQLEGAAADDHVFSDSSSLAQPYLLASPLAPGKVSLDAGQVQGMTVGSVFHVYGPGTKNFDPPAQPIAVVELTSVTPFTSEARVVSGSSVPPASRAVERQHQYANFKLRVWFEKLSGSPTLRSISTALAPHGQIEVVTEPSQCHLQVRQEGGNIVTLSADGTDLSPAVPVADREVAKKVADQLVQWAKWFNVLSIKNPQPTSRIEFTLKATRAGQSRDPFQQIGTADVAMDEDEKIEATVKNISSKQLYISMLDLSTDGSIAVIYPTEPGSKELLAAGASLTRTFETFVPEGRKSVKDALKVFASNKPIDLRPLSQEAIRGEPVPDDPLNRLLNQAAQGTRNVRPRTELSDWVTVERVVEVRRKE